MGLLGAEYFRRKTQARFESRGITPQTARLAAVAMHPFQNSRPPTSRALTRYVRDVSRVFTQDSRLALSEEALRRGARGAVQRYAVAAKILGDHPYAHEWRSELDASARAGETALEVFGLESELAAEMGLRDRYSTEISRRAPVGDLESPALAGHVGRKRGQRRYFVVMDGLGGAPRITRFPATAKRGARILGPFSSKDDAKEAGRREESGAYFEL